MKTRILFLVSLLLLNIVALKAQPINESDVPEDVFTGFKYKYPGANIRGWETRRGNFLANFKIEEQEGLAEFTANGKWLESRFTIPEKELPSPIITYYKDNYKTRGFVITESVLVKNAAGETYYFLQAKKSGISQPKPSELYFDLAGKLTRKEEPEENATLGLENKENIEVTKDKEYKETKETKESRDAKETKQTKEEKQDTVVPNTNISKKELPTLAVSYIKLNYPEHAIKETKLINDAEMGDVYFISLKQEGIKEQVELYFDINGNLVKKVDNKEIMAQQVKDSREDNEEIDETEKKTSIEEPRKEPEVPAGPVEQTVDENRVPSVAKTHFLSKTRKATNVEWFRLDRDFLVRYISGGAKGFKLYSEEGNWKETRNEMTESSLSSPIRDYLKKNYRRLKIVRVENVMIAPKVKFIEVQMVDKYSKEAKPAVTKVFFDSSSKFISDEKPEEESDAEKKKKDDKEFLQEVDASGVKRINEGTDANEEISVKELPTNVIDYIKKNYPEHKIKDTRYIFDDDLNDHVYYVTAKKEGIKHELEFYFSLSGKLLKKIDPAEQKADQDFQSDIKDFSDDFEQEDKQTIDQKDLPGGIKTYLKQKYPDYKVESSVFYKDEDMGNVYFLTLKKSGVKSKTLLYFDLNGKLVKSEKEDQ